MHGNFALQLPFPLSCSEHGQHFSVRDSHPGKCLNQVTYAIRTDDLLIPATGPIKRDIEPAFADRLDRQALTHVEES